MQADEMLHALTEYFGQGKYPEPVIRAMRRVVETISDADRETVYGRMLETNKGSYKISVAEIVEACKDLGVAYRETKYIPASDWLC